MTAVPEAPEVLPYRLVVPQGWTRLPVDPTRMRTAARAMMLRKLADHPRDATAALWRQVEPELAASSADVLSNARRYARWLDTGSEHEAAHDADPVPTAVLQAARTTRCVDVLLPAPDVPRVLLSFTSPWCRCSPRSPSCS